MVGFRIETKFNLASTALREIVSVVLVLLEISIRTVFYNASFNNISGQWRYVGFVLNEFLSDVLIKNSMIATGPTS